MPSTAHSLASFWDKREHRRILALTLPMVLANVTTPLLGLVDTAVLGRLPGLAALAGAAIATLMLTQIYWVCGFLRMSTTGLSAQSKGAQDSDEGLAVLLRSSVLALLLGTLILLLQQPIYQIGIRLADAQPAMLQAIESYFFVRVWGAPAAMLNMALIGWLIGQQQSRQVMIVQVWANLLNAALDVLFVFGFGWDIAGVAAASVIAEYVILFGSLIAVRRRLTKMSAPAGWLQRRAFVRLLSLNGHMFARNLVLQLCLAFLTFQGARFGDVYAATNAILMQFFVLIALGLDAVAFAAEAMVGEAKGARDTHKLLRHTQQTLLWSLILALIYSVCFGVGMHAIVGLLTDNPQLHTAAMKYHVAILILPLLAHWCFLFDGVYIALTRASAMSRGMLFSAIAVYFPLWWAFRDLGNPALWIALLGFLLARGITLGGHFTYLSRTGRLLD